MMHECRSPATAYLPVMWSMASWQMPVMDASGPYTSI